MSYSLIHNKSVLGEILTVVYILIVGFGAVIGFWLSEISK